VRYLVGFAVSFILAHGARSAEPAWQVRTEFLFVRVPQAEVLRLIPRLRRAGTTEEAVADVQRSIAAGKVELLAAPVVWSEDGKRATAETIEEVRYPTEFNPPQQSGIFVNRTQHGSAAAVKGLIDRVVDVPTAFETRNAGVSFELTPMVREGGCSIALVIDPQHVMFEGMKSTRCLPASTTDWPFEQPRFRTHKTTTTLDVESGKWWLFSVSVHAGAEPHADLCLLRATALPLQP